MPDREELDPSLEATDEERAAAERLRRALGDGTPHEDADVLRALARAYAPRELSAGEHAKILRGALGRRAVARPGAAVRYAFFGVAGALALAAGVAFFVGRAFSPSAPRRVAFDQAPVVLSGPDQAPVAIARVRSTQPLFHRPFRAEDGSARVDRIAMSRASDLRDNRFARWGVR